MHRSWKLLLVACAILGAGCIESEKESTLFYNLSRELPRTVPGPGGTHYEQFAEIHDISIARVGCFAVLNRQIHKTDVTQDEVTGEVAPKIRSVVSECTCPCVDMVPEDDLAPFGMITPGKIVGTLDDFDIQFLGGVELSTTIVLSHATGLFIVQKSNDDEDDEPFTPSSVSYLGGELERNGDVIQGPLTSSQPSRPSGYVTILPFESGEPL